jgi:hypothetical protein
MAYGGKYGLRKEEDFPHHQRNLHRRLGYKPDDNVPDVVFNKGDQFGKDDSFHDVMLDLKTELDKASGDYLGWYRRNKHDVCPSQWKGATTTINARFTYSEIPYLDLFLKTRNTKDRVLRDANAEALRLKRAVEKDKPASELRYDAPLLVEAASMTGVPVASIGDDIGKVLKALGLPGGWKEDDSNASDDSEEEEEESVGGGRAEGTQGDEWEESSDSGSAFDFLWYMPFALPEETCVLWNQVLSRTRVSRAVFLAPERREAIQQLLCMLILFTTEVQNSRTSCFGLIDQVVIGLPWDLLLYLNLTDSVGNSMGDKARYNKGLAKVIENAPSSRMIEVLINVVNGVKDIPADVWKGFSDYAALVPVVRNPEQHKVIVTWRTSPVTATASQKRSFCRGWTRKWGRSGGRS